MVCTNWASGEANCLAVPALYVHYISMYINTGFHNSVKTVPRATLWTQHLRTVQYKSSQQFRLTPRTVHQCVPFCDYSQIQAKYRLNIALHFNLQPTTYIVTKCTHNPASYPLRSHHNIYLTFLYQLNSYNFKTQWCSASYSFISLRYFSPNLIPAFIL
jgi:hypothetical protein